MRATYKELENRIIELETALSEMEKDKDKLSNRLYDPLPSYEQNEHHFMVIDAETYEVKQSNHPILKNGHNEKLRCFKMIHKNDNPCSEIEHMCPIAEVKKRKESARVEHRHFDENHIARKTRIDGFPLFDTHGNVKDVIVYAAEVRDCELTVQSLAEGNSRIEDILRVAPIGIGVIKNRVFSLVNDTIFHMLGYTSEELMGQSTRMLYPTDEEYERIGRKMYNHIRDHGVCSAETQWLCKDGKILEIYLTLSPADPADPEAYCTFTALDITEKKRAVHKLEQQEDRLNIVLKASTDGIWDWNIAENDVFSSPRCYTMLGYEPYEFPSTYDSWVNLVHPDDRENLIRETSDLLNKLKDSFASETRLRTKDGSWRWIYSRGSIVEWDKNGKPLRMVGTHVDFTDRKQAEEALRKSEHLHRNIIETMNEGFVMFDEDDRIMFANNRILEISGSSKDQILGKYISDLPFYNTSNDFRENRMTFIRNGIKDSYELEFTDKQRKVKLVKLSTSPFFNNDGGYAGCFSIVTDLTKRKEKEMDSLMLEKASSLASIGVMAAGITHEINQPLTSIKFGVDGLLYLIRKNIDVSLDKLVESLENVSKGASRIENIIKHMKTYWSESASSEQTERVDLNQTVTKSLLLIDRQLSSHGIEIEVDLSKEPVTVLGKQIHFEQIVINLVVNAMNILDTLDTPDKSIKIVTYIDQSNECAILEVHDNGTGIEEENAEMIFDPFYTKSSDKRGMGLGLAIIKRFTDDYRGTVEVTNNDSGGATFSLCFPVSQESGDL